MTDEQAINAVLDEQNQAMVKGDIAALQAMQQGGFVLVHITGYQQPATEWLSQIRSGYFNYHQIDPQSSTVTVVGDKAKAVRRAVLDVTIGGSRGRWRLESTSELIRKNGRWLLAYTRARTY